MTQQIEIFDRKNRLQKLQRCQKQFSDYNFLFEWSENQIAERLLDVNRTFDTALHLGSYRSGTKLKDSPKIKQMFTMDVLGHNDLIADEEFFPFGDNSLDLITGCLNLHTINDLPGALVQMRKALKPDGLFMASLFGGETLFELRESLSQAEIKLKDGVSPRIFPFADKPQMGDLMGRAGFALPVIDSEIITVTYDNMFKLMADIRGMGESNIIKAKNHTNPGKALFMAAAEHYAQNFSDPDGRIRASFEIIFLIGWAPHESQQKPLKPGSARTRLADILQTEEIKTGEMP